jgi:2-methylcitrate dehydratase PrpD
MVSLLTKTYDSNTPLSVSADEERISTITTKLGDSTELTARIGQKYLTTEVGFIPNSQCYYVQSPIMAVKKALRGEYIDMDKIRWIDLVGLQWLAALKNKYTEDIAGRMATATALLINNVSPEVAWYLNGELENTAVRVLASKIRFFMDPNSWIDVIESRDSLFRASIETTDGRKRLGIVKHGIKGIVDVTTENQFKTRFSDYTSYTLGDEKAQKLQKALLEQDDIGVTNLMKLVQPKFWSFF